MPAPPPLDEQLCFALYSAGMAVNRVYKPALDRLGLTYPQFLVLQALRERDGLTVGAIANRLWLDPSTVTPIVKRMETAGLIARRRSRVDEREVHVHLTEAGKARWAETGCLAETMLERSGMSPTSLASLARTIAGLRAALADHDVV